MDSDLEAALGGSPATNEKLYSLAIQDVRLHEKERDTDFHSTRAKDEAFRADVQAKVEAFRAEWMRRFDEMKAILEAAHEAIPAEENFNVYMRLLAMGMDARQQQMSTATTWNTMLDVINDAFKMAEEMYPRVLAKKAEIFGPTPA